MALAAMGFTSLVGILTAHSGQSSSTSPNMEWVLTKVFYIHACVTNFMRVT
jgi:hypothetical protein